MNKIIKVVGAVLLAFAAIMAVTTLTEKPVDAQSVQPLRDFAAIRLNVYPQGDDTTNAATIWDKTGTNGIQFSPINATPSVVISNNVYTTPVYQTIIVTNSTGGAGTAHTLTFRNGLLTSVAP